MANETQNGRPNGKDQFNKAAPEVVFDVAAYAPFLENSEMTEAQKEELLRTIWKFLLLVVDLGMDVRRVSFGNLDEVEAAAREADLRALEALRDEDAEFAAEIFETGNWELEP